MRDVLLLLILPLVFFGMLGAGALGRRLGKVHFVRNPSHPDAGVGTLDAAMLALLGLLVAFTFSGAADRYNVRRDLIVEEANMIATAYLRLDLLPEAVQPNLRAEFRRYVDARIAFYRSLTEPDEALGHKLESEALEGTIWRQAVSSARAVSSSAATMLVIDALNQMIDITATRATSLITHPPIEVYALLGLLALVGALLSGFGTAACEHPSRFHRYGFAAIVALTIYLTIDLEFPRHGLIRVDAADQILLDARSAMR